MTRHCWSRPWVLFLLALLFSCCWAWIPPHPGSDHHSFLESVHDMRRRLGIQYNYTPKLVHPELCRFHSERECQELDKNMMETAKRNLLVVSDPGDNLATGNVRVLILLIVFDDHQERERLPKQAVEEQWNGPIKKWFSLNSGGLYEIEPVVVEWFVTDNTEKYYSFGKRGVTSETQQMAWPILSDLDNRPDWDWGQFDGNGDGKLDAVVMLHSGYGGEAGTTDCYGADFQDRLWAHAYSSDDRVSWTSNDGSVALNGYVIASAYNGKCDANQAEIGLVIHEYMHTLGLIDLYDVNPEFAPGDLPGVGTFCLMAFPYGQGGNGNNPGHLNVYSRQAAGWIKPKEVTDNIQYTLRPIETSDDAYRITLADFGFYPEYLLIENRQPLEFDSDMWQGGIVIYHVDDALQKQDTRGYPGQYSWPQDGNHYKVALLPKDGLYELERGMDLGDAGDMWVPGDSLGPGEGNTVFPNTDAYQGGFVFETGIRINILSQDGNDITIGVEGIDPSKFSASESESDSEPASAGDANQPPASSNSDKVGGVPIGQANTALLVVFILILLSFACCLVPFGWAHYKKYRDEKAEDVPLVEALAVVREGSEVYSSVKKDIGNDSATKEGSSHTNKDERSSATDEVDKDHGV